MAVEGLAGLRGVLLANHRDEVARQFAKKLLGYALGRSVQLSDEPLLERLEEASGRGVAEMVRIIDQLAAVTVVSTPEQMARKIADEIALWGQVAKSVGIKPE